MRTIADAPGSALPPLPPPGTPTLARLSRSGLGRLCTAHAASLGRPGPPVPIPVCSQPPSSGSAAPGVPSQPTLTSSPSPMPFTTTAAAASSRPLRRSRRPPASFPAAAARSAPRRSSGAGASPAAPTAAAAPPAAAAWIRAPARRRGEGGREAGSCRRGRASDPASPAALEERGGLGLSLRARPDGSPARGDPACVRAGWRGGGSVVTCGGSLAPALRLHFPACPAARQL